MRGLGTNIWGFRPIVDFNPPTGALGPRTVVRRRARDRASTTGYVTAGYLLLFLSDVASFSAAGTPFALASALTFARSP